MTKTQYNFRLNSETINKIDNYPTCEPNFLHQTRTEKLREIINTHDKLIDYTKKELVDYFTYGEVNYLIHVYHDSIYTVNTTSPKNYIIWLIEDFSSDNTVHEEFGIDVNVLVNKIKKMTAFQCLTVILMANEYLIESESNDNNDADIRKIFMITKYA